MSIIDYYKWFKSNWSKMTPIIAIFLFVVLFVFVMKYDFIVFLILIQTPIYMLHQTEEYIFPGGFQEYFNTQIFRVDRKRNL